MDDDRTRALPANDPADDPPDNGDLEPTRQLSAMAAMAGDDAAATRLMAPATSTVAGDATAIEHDGQIGPYRLGRKLGEGGMGEVYAAEQQEPIRRRVALKIVKHGLNSAEFQARFASERQALALMDHSCIAKVFDAGATDHGRPYFVMEYIEGVTLSEYCDQHRSTVVERLELFIRVCDGVRHAHQKAIIHRDLKPSNVLVTEQEEGPIPKIIDFGVAKALDQPLTDEGTKTALGQVIGTPEYMSPEQAALTDQGIDTRTDIYALGVLLYELLIGVRPFDPDELRKLSFPEVLRTICEVDPPRPSARLKALGERAATLAEMRQSEPKQLVKSLRGDLDWIVMKALAKDPDHRYQTVNALAADLRRHLNDEPVEAGPPSVSYRTGKFVRRHRVGVTVTVSALVLLIGFAFSVTVQASRIARERDRANREATAATQVAEFLVELFEVSDPSEARGNSITAREVLDRGAERIERELGDQPRIQARMQATMGQVYRSMGLYEAAAPLLTMALDTQVDLLGAQDPQALRTALAVARLRWDQGEYDAAERLYSEAIATSLAVNGEEHLLTAKARGGLANLYAKQGRYEEAQPLYLAALATFRALYGPHHVDTLGATSNLGLNYWNLGEAEQATALLSEALPMARRNLGVDHPQVLRTMNNLAIMYREQGDLEAAVNLQTEALAAMQRVFGDRNRETLMVKMGLATLYQRQGRYAEADRIYNEVLAVQREVLGENHLETAWSIYNLACLRSLEGRHQAALDYLAEAVSRGWADPLISSDGDLDPLRSYEAFTVLENEVAARLAQSEEF